MIISSFLLFSRTFIFDQAEVSMMEYSQSYYQPENVYEILIA